MPSVETYPSNGSLSKYYWNVNTLWSDGYFASTVGNVSKEATEYYILNQD